MSLQTPAWWYRKGAQGAPWWRFALWPLSLIWQAVNAIKRANAKPYRSSLFVISVGNLTLGGSGKTPVTAEILRLLGDKAVGLSKGYSGSLDGPVLVDPAKHTAAEVGDEPLMLAQGADFVVAKDRAAGLRLIEVSDAKVAVVDDSHQNLKIAKDLHVLVVDGDTRNDAWPFGDSGICPYGPMREPFAEGLARADVVALWLPDAEAQADPELLALFRDKPIFVARLEAEKPPIVGRVIGFAGIAKPWKFEATLKMQGFDVAGFQGFPDHAALASAELEALAKRAEESDAQLIATEKDWVRLDKTWQGRVTYLPIRANFDDETGFVAALNAALAKTSSL